MKELLLDAQNPAHRVYDVGGTHQMAATVEPGHAFSLRTLDASGNQITEATCSADELVQAELFPATGPVGISNVNAGDGVLIEVLRVVPGSEGHIWTRPNLGFGPAPDFHVRRVSTLDLELELGRTRVTLASRLHIGTLGIAPQETRSARDVGDYGGNIDAHFLGAGSALWLTAQQDGAGVFAADVHASIGDAEICGTGVEAEAVIDLRVQRRDWGPPLPLIIDRGRVWAVGTGVSLEEALDQAVRYIHQRITDGLKISSRDAYLAVSALLEIQVCQVVNPHHSVAVSVGSGLDRFLMPAESAW